MIREEWRLDLKLKSPEMLRQYMAYKGLNIRDLAKSAGVHRATIGHLHSGARGGKCSPDTARRIEQALACPPGLLFEARASKVSREVAA